MRRGLVRMLLILIVPGVAWAADPLASIEGQPTVPPRGVMILSGLKAQSDKPIVWKQRNGPAQVIFFTLDQGDKKGVVLFAPQMPEAPGVYRFVMVCRGTPVGATELTADADVFDVTVTGTPGPVPPNPNPPGPAPNPVPPNPDPVPPKPDPTPVVTEHLHLSYIVDANSFGVAEAAMKRNKVIELGILPLDANFRWFQSDEVELTADHILAPAQAVGLPCLLIQKPNGQIIDKIRSPTPEQVVAKVRELRGLK